MLYQIKCNVCLFRWPKCDRSRYIMVRLCVETVNAAAARRGKKFDSGVTGQ